MQSPLNIFPFTGGARVACNHSSEAASINYLISFANNFVSSSSCALYEPEFLGWCRSHKLRRWFRSRWRTPLRDPQCCRSKNSPFPRVTIFLRWRQCGVTEYLIGIGSRDCLAGYGSPTMTEAATMQALYRRLASKETKFMYLSEWNEGRWANISTIPPKTITNSDSLSSPFGHATEYMIYKI